MKLYVCWGLFRTPSPGHPCRNAHDALKAVGWRPEIMRCYGWGLLPRFLNRTRGRRAVVELTGQRWVPVLVADRETVVGSRSIRRWAEQHPAPGGTGLAEP
jgi:hypothetical protein